jgi:hypothetical protein
MRFLNRLLLPALLVLSLPLGAGAASPVTSRYVLCEKQIVAFQKILDVSKGVGLRVVSGIAYATPEGVRKKTYTVILKCVDAAGTVYAAAIYATKGVVEVVHLRATEERQLDL